MPGIADVSERKPALDTLGHRGRSRLRTGTSAKGPASSECLTRYTLHRSMSAAECQDPVQIGGYTCSCREPERGRDRERRVPTYHMEAGNRCFDANVPEETNRRLVDHTADFNLAYTEHARRNLLAEGLHPRRIIVTGSPMAEVLEQHAAAIAASGALANMGVAAGEYFLVSAHREENVDSPDRLRSLLECLNAVAGRWGLPVLVSTHPRTRKRLEDVPDVAVSEFLRFHEPFGFLEYNRLQLDARCVLSDSGTIAEESTILGFPAVTLRSSIERPEALDTGAITMTDLQPEAVLRGIAFAVGRGAPQRPADYQISNTSERVVNFILSTAFQHEFWSGLR